jgi:putative ABC transport system ATP-binding protein
VQSRAQPVLSLQDVYLLRRQGGSSFELQVPDFQVARGEFVAVTGESGCGKSTLLDMLALVLQPQQGGHFRFYDAQGGEQDISALWQSSSEDQLAVLRRTRLGYVPQSGGLLPFLTIAQNLYLPPRLNGQKDYEHRIRAFARRLGIHGLLSRMPQSLSGGQRQRAAILRAMAHEPDVILADEPTAAVDAGRAQKIVSEFRELARSQGTAIIMVTHDRNLVENNSDGHFVFDVDSSDETKVVSVCRRRE